MARRRPISHAYDGNAAGRLSRLDGSARPCSLPAAKASIRTQFWRIGFGSSIWPIWLFAAPESGPRRFPQILENSLCPAERPANSSDAAGQHVGDNREET